MLALIPLPTVLAYCRDSQRTKGGSERTKKVRLSQCRDACAMGAEQSMPSSMGFEALWASLPDDVQASVAALASKESDVILKPNPKAPGPLPPVPVGVTVRLDSEMARAALLIVPRLQRKHYETIPKLLDEMTFWVCPCPTLTHTVLVPLCTRCCRRR